MRAAVFIDFEDPIEPRICSAFEARTANTVTLEKRSLREIDFVEAATREDLLRFRSPHCKHELSSDFREKVTSERK